MISCREPLNGTKREGKGRRKKYLSSDVLYIAKVQEKPPR